jgi:acyl dehydratase
MDDYYEVGREKVREYARAVQDYHPVHWVDDVAVESGYSGLVAPLTFVSLIGVMAQRKLSETVMADYDLSQLMQTGQALEFHRPIQAGDRLNCDVYLDSFRQAFGGDLIGIKNVITDVRDEPVLTSFTNIVGRSGIRDEKLSRAAGRLVMHGVLPGSPATPGTRPTRAARTAAPAAHTPAAHPQARAFESVAVGDELPPRLARITQGDLVNYAGVSGDPNPIHWSDELADMVELDSAVAHGMLTIALGAGFVTSWLGDPGAVTELNVRLTSPVYVRLDRPGEIEYTGKVKSVDADARTAVIAISGVHRGKKIFGRAVATVKLS